MHPLRTTTWTTVVVLLLAVALPLWGGCGSSGSSPAAGPLPVIDMAAVSENWPEDSVFVWLDALNNPANARAPDVLLEVSDWSDYDNRVRYVRIVGEQLFVLSTHNNSDGGVVMIWNDFRTIEGNPEPDVLLEQSSGISHCNYMAIHGGDLYVSNRRGSNVLIFRDTLTLGSGATPDAILGNNPFMLVAVEEEGHSPYSIYQPNCVLVSDHALYVTSPDNNLVAVYYDPALLQTGDAPDVILGDAPEEEPPLAGATALLGGSQLAGPKHCFLEGNTLYVSCVDRGNGSANGVWGFTPADALVDYQTPDFVIGGPGMDSYPMCVRQAGGKLWVATRDYETGLLAYSATPSTGELPHVELMSDLFFGGDNKVSPWSPEEGAFTFVPGRVYEIVSIAGGLVGVSNRNDAIFGYLDASTIVTDQVPDYVVWWPGMEEIRSIDAVIR